MPTSFFKSAATDRRLQLFVLCSALSLVLGFFSFSDTTALLVVAKAGYWFELAAFLLFAHALWRTFREELRSFSWRTFDWPTFGLVAACGTILLVHEARGFKIVMDEVMLLGTSMNMHFNREATAPLRGNDIQGAFALLEGSVDKRPLFFPFLLSLAHDLTGYRPANAFLLNGALTYVFLGLAALAGRLLAGRSGAWLSVLLFAGLPLLGQNAVGGGFELLNLTMALGTLLLGVRLLTKPAEASFAAFCFSALLLCQVRYESCLLAAPAVLLVFWLWRREGRVVFSWEVALAPLLLVVLPLQHVVFRVNPGTWELDSKPGFTTPFSLAYLPDNVAHALAFFFGLPSDQPNSLFFSALGVLALPFALLLLAKQVRRLRELEPVRIASALFFVGLLAHALVMMAYFWGRFDDPVIRRLSLPVHLLFLLSILLVLPELFRGEKPRWILAAAAGLAVLAVGIPSMASHAYTQQYLPGLEVAWKGRFVATHPSRDYLVLDVNGPFWVTHEVSATTIVRAREHVPLMEFHLRNRSYSAIYVFQSLKVDPETGKTSYREGEDLGPAFELETVWEERLQALTVSRISRVVAIRGDKETVRAEAPLAEAVAPKDPKADEAAREAYMKNFIKMLP